MKSVTKTKKPNIDATLGKKIEYARTNLGMSQGELAQLLHVKRETISYYENDNRIPDANTLKDIAKNLKVSTDYLLGITDFESSNTDYISINKITGLSLEAIENLDKLNNSYKSYLIKIINFLIEEETYYPEEEYLTSKYYDIDDYDTSEEEKEKLKKDVSDEIESNYKNRKNKKPLHLIKKVSDYLTTKLKSTEEFYITNSRIVSQNDLGEDVDSSFIKASKSKVVDGNEIIDKVLLDDISDILKDCKKKYTSSNEVNNQ